MAHVRIHRNEDDERPVLRIEVDGVDLTHHVYRTDDFGLVLVGDDPATQCWGVRMVIAADALDLDLPDAVLDAVARTPAEMMGDES